uniref:Uncharacterized protein n=1 Tax=Tanacetum cinerariifolium TaxID=118510 RepID=A0A699IEJ2_TANCI|nr:hypothetical protein [Tanacetum cinerariifolium]
MPYSCLPIRRIFLEPLILRTEYPLDMGAERHLWLRYEGQEYSDAKIHNFERRLSWIFDRQINRIQVLDFDGLNEEMGQALTDRLRMGHTDAHGQIVDPLRRLCHRLIAFSISGRGQAPEKVTATYLFYLRSMDEGTVILEEGVQADPAPVQVPQAPLAAPGLRNMLQRI